MINSIFYKLNEIINDFHQIIYKLPNNLINNFDRFANGILPMISHYHLNEFLHEIFFYTFKTYLG